MYIQVLKHSAECKDHWINSTKCVSLSKPLSLTKEQKLTLEEKFHLLPTHFERYSAIHIKSWFKQLQYSWKYSPVCFPNMKKKENSCCFWNISCQITGLISERLLSFPWLLCHNNLLWAVSTLRHSGCNYSGYILLSRFWLELFWLYFII